MINLVAAISTPSSEAAATNAILTWAFRAFFLVGMGVTGFLFRWLFIRAVRKVDEFGNWRQGIAEKGDVLTKGEFQELAEKSGFVTRDKYFQWHSELCEKCPATLGLAHLVMRDEGLSKEGGNMTRSEHILACERVGERSAAALNTAVEAQSKLIQSEFKGIREVLELVTNRQAEVINRIDAHVNGHHQS